MASHGRPSLWVDPVYWADPQPRNRNGRGKEWIHLTKDVKRCPCNDCPVRRGCVTECEAFEDYLGFRQGNYYHRQQAARQKGPEKGPD